MCLITCLEAREKFGTLDIDENHFKNAWYWNEDGAGISFVDYNYSLNPIVKVYKNYNTFNKFIRVFRRLRELNPKSKFLVHLRNASMGDLSKENCHPFWIHKNKLSMAHNGTMYKMNASKDKGESDSVKLAKFLSTLPEGFIHNSGYWFLLRNYIGVNRLAFLDDANNIKMMGTGWIEAEKDLIFHSNDYFKKEIPVKVIPFNQEKKEESCADCGVIFDESIFPVQVNDKKYCYHCFNKIDKKDSMLTIPVCCVCGKQIMKNPYSQYDGKNVCSDECIDVLKNKNNIRKCACGIELNPESRTEMNTGVCTSCSEFWERRVGTDYDDGYGGV